MLAFISDQIATDATLPVIGMDPLTDGLPQGAVPFLFDLIKDYTASHADLPYADGDVIEDIDRNADGHMRVAAGHAVTSDARYGGADFSALATAGASFVEGPIGSLAALQAAQHFAIALYVVLPTEADWDSVSTIAPFFQSATTTYTAGPDLATICQVTSSGTKYLRARRQRDGASAVADLQLAPDPAAYGKPALIMYWRTAAGSALRLKTSASDQTVTAAAAADNTGAFGTTTPKFGVVPGFWNFTGQPAHLNAANFTLLRGWIADLDLFDADMTEIGTADFVRVTNRIGALSS